MDNNTAAAVIQSEIDDIDNILEGYNTEAERNGDSDARFALQLYQKDIKAHQAVLNDRRIACSVSAALASDGYLIEEAQREEHINPSDHQAAIVHGRHRVSHAVLDLPPRHSEKLNDDLAALNRVGQIPIDYVFPIARGVTEMDNAESDWLHLASSGKHQLYPSFDSEKSGTIFGICSGSARSEQSSLQSAINENAIWGSLKLPTRPTTIEKAQTKPNLTASVSTASDSPPASYTCASCADDGPYEDMLHTSCGHSYCLECTTQYVKVSLHPDSTFPPSCCNLPLTLPMIENYVSLDVIRQYTAKQDEIANACSLRCAQPSCKTMIPLDNVEESKGICPICHKRTCRNCKLAWHESHVCNEGNEREKIVKLAKEKGWQFCFMCRNCVGISHGCNHITCLCKAEFCYVCGVKWRHCDCPRWDEDLLLGKAERLLHRIRRLNDDRPRGVQLAEMQKMLRVDCNHPGWHYEVHTKGNPGVCRLCGLKMRKFILRCYQCHRAQCLSCTGPIAIAQAEAVPAQATAQKRKLSIMDPIVDVDEPLVAEPQKRRHVNLALEGTREKAREKVLEAVCC